MTSAMASSSCWQCLSRPATQLMSPAALNILPKTTIASFSSTSRTHATPPKAKKGAAASLKTRVAKSFAIKKKAVVKTGKPPMPGERKAMRKRIVLSNTNALEVEGMVDLGKEMDLGAVVGKVVGIPGEVVDSLRAAEAFKVTQGWGLFRRPGLLVREESAAVAGRMKEVEESKGTLRLTVDGGRGTGKSLMLLHAMVTAFVRGWLVLNIPDAKELTNAVTEYAPIPNTTPTLYSQDAYTAAWLSQIAKSNSTLLQSMEVSQEHTLPIPLQSNITLARLCELGARDPEVSWPVFQAFWSEITAEGRPPVLMTLDGLNHIMGNSSYRSTDFKEVHALDLAILKHFTDYFSGIKKLPNGGAVMAATSRSHSPNSTSMDFMITLAEDRQAGRAFTQRNPFEKKYDARAEDGMKDADVMKLGGLSKLEARGLMEYWAQSGVLRQKVDERSVAEKWALAGNGVVGEIERGALRMRI